VFSISLVKVIFLGLLVPPPAQVLKKTNLYNDAFHIWHEGHFGTINGFRLGDLPSCQVCSLLPNSCHRRIFSPPPPPPPPPPKKVPWEEINAAWGQAVLLLYTIAKKLNFKFSTYVPWHLSTPFM